MPGSMHKIGQSAAASPCRWLSGKPRHSLSFPSSCNELSPSHFLWLHLSSPRVSHSINQASAAEKESRGWAEGEEIYRKTTIQFICIMQKGGESLH